MNILMSVVYNNDEKIWVKVTQFKWYMNDYIKSAVIEAYQSMTVAYRDPWRHFLFDNVPDVVAVDRVLTRIAARRVDGHWRSSLSAVFIPVLDAERRRDEPSV